MKKNVNITKPHDSEDVASPFALHNIEVALYNDQLSGLAKPGGLWHPTVALGRQEDLSFFIQIIWWAHEILQVQSTGLPSIFLTAQTFLSYRMLSCLPV